ncbi:single-stranded DNA-binding protein [Neobacillus sp. YIM B06451]|uniref:single-stranded DNA-binding protein n=1 Tax=Neobacillus sp. YIM B06451 TaxID=3070994 RepID=UPI00292DE233|nr:single-stranded DNA-binding protein [Neobacillus sp. YIM B06451]
MINQVTLVGRLTKNPELKVTTEGTPVSNVILAVNRQYKNSHGDYDTDFVQCTLWKKAAENTVQYCRKGSVVGITGRIQTRHYDNQDGKRVYVTEVVAESIRFLSGKPSESASHEMESSRSVPIPGMDAQQTAEPEPIPFRQQQPLHQEQTRSGHVGSVAGHSQIHQPPHATAASHDSYPHSQPVPPPFTFEKEPSAPSKEEFPFG